MTTLKLTITDVIFQPREVEVPEVCPHCGTSFEGGEGMFLTFYEFVQYKSQGNADTLTFKYEEALSSWDDNNQPCLNAFCQACGGIVLGSDCQSFQKKPEVPQPPVEKTLDALLVGAGTMEDLPS